MFLKKFPKEKGWFIYHSIHVNLLLIKSEIDDKIKEEIIKNFLSIKNFKLIRKNIKSNKFKGKYEEFKERIILPQKYLNKYLKSKYVKHFYTKKELKNIKNKFE